MIYNTFFYPWIREEDKLKKLLMNISICCLVILLPTAVGLPAHQQVPNLQSYLNTQSRIMDDIPDWANGNFTGEWGITLFGIPAAPAGWITGYYENIGLGKLDAVYAIFNETNATAFLRGIMLWIFFMGGAGSLQGGNATWVVGIGVANETHFYWRINAIIGPSFYIHCAYTPFTNTTRQN